MYRNIKTVTGAIYDGVNVHYQTKDAKLNLLFRAATLEELWNNFDALLFNLTRPYEHVLAVTATEEAFYCSYKSCSVQEFFPDGQIWLMVRLTLTVYSRVTSEDMEEALGIIPPDDMSEAAITVRQRVAASVTADNVVLPFQTQEEIDDSMLLSSEDGIIVFKDDDDSFAISIYPDRFNYTTDEKARQEFIDSQMALYFPDTVKKPEDNGGEQPVIKNIKEQTAEARALVKQLEQEIADLRSGKTTTDANGNEIKDFAAEIAAREKALKEAKERLATLTGETDKGTKNNAGEAERMRRQVEKDGQALVRLKEDLLSPLSVVSALPKR